MALLDQKLYTMAKYRIPIPTSNTDTDTPLAESASCKQCSSPQSALAHVRRLLKHFSCRCFYMMRTTDDLGMSVPRDISLCCEFGAMVLMTQNHIVHLVNVFIRVDTSPTLWPTCIFACRPLPLEFPSLQRAQLSYHHFI